MITWNGNDKAFDIMVRAVENAEQFYMGRWGLAGVWMRLSIA